MTLNSLPQLSFSSAPEQHFVYSEPFYTGVMSIDEQATCELEAELALASMLPPPPHEPHSTLVVYLLSASTEQQLQIGILKKFVFLRSAAGDRPALYEFESSSGNTKICGPTPESVMDLVQERLAVV